MDEKIVSAQPFLPFPRSLVRTKAEALQELAQPCGRFQSPLTLGESFRLLLSGELGKTDPLGNVEAILAPGVPLNWQILLRYLHGHDLITEPHFTFGAHSNDLPKMYEATLRGPLNGNNTDGKPVEGMSHGISHSADIAMTKAVGETLERRFLTIYRQKSFVRSSYGKLSGGRTPVVNIFDLNSFLPWQQQKNPRLARTASAPVYWIQGETIAGKPAYIPAQLVFWNYNFDLDTEEPILGQSTTNGAGGHFTREEAVLSGLLETIERDGFLIYWLNRIPPRVIDVSSVHDDELQTFLASIDRYGLSIYFLNTTTDVEVPAVTCVIIDAREKEPVLSIGAASGFNIKETILKSGYEALSVLQSRSGREAFQLPETYEPFTDPHINQSKRSMLWKGRDMLERFNFFLAGTRQSPQEFFAAVPQDLPLAERLKYVLQKLARLGSGYEVYLYEARHAVLKTLGYHVVQTVVPQLISMYLNEHLAPLDSKRLREVPAKLGYKAAEIVNPWPHPFP